MRTAAFASMQNMIVKMLRKSLDGACEEHRQTIRALLDKDLHMLTAEERDHIWEQASR